MVKFHKIWAKINISILVKWFVWISLAFAFFGAIVDRNYFVLFLSALTFFLTLMPYFFREKLHLKLPQILELVIILFLYAALFLGEIENYYYVYWWWDLLLHGFSALALGFIGAGILYEMDKRTILEARPSTLVFFGFCFAIAIGTVWEIVEFSIDGFFGTNMQKSGLRDTMWDLIVDAFGALVAAVLSYFYIKRINRRK
jgi:hypothetical protein